MNEQGSNVQRFLVCKAHTRWYHSNLGLRVIKQKKKMQFRFSRSGGGVPASAKSARHRPGVRFRFQALLLPRERERAVRFSRPELVKCSRRRVWNRGGLILGVFCRDLSTFARKLGPQLAHAGCVSVLMVWLRQRRCVLRPTQSPAQSPRHDG